MERAMKRSRSCEPVRGACRGGRFQRLGAGIAGVLLLSGAVLLADVFVSGYFKGDTINYKVTGVAPNESFTVILTHVETEQGNQYDEQSSGEGKIEGSGTTGDHIENGDHVKIDVVDADGSLIGSNTIQKGKQHAPWWAYTVVGTLVYWFQKL